LDKTKSCLNCSIAGICMDYPAAQFFYVTPEGQKATIEDIENGIEVDYSDTMKEQAQRLAKYCHDYRLWVFPDIEAYKRGLE